MQRRFLVVRPASLPEGRGSFVSHEALIAARKRPSLNRRSVAAAVHSPLVDTVVGKARALRKPISLPPSPVGDAPSEWMC